MGKSNISSPYLIEVQRQKMINRVKRKYDTEIFREHIKHAQTLISGGNTLHEVQQRLGLREGNEWNDLKFALAQAYIKPENLILEWSIRQQSRYKLAADAYNMARTAKDHDGMLRAIMVMSKVDENDIELKKALGLLKPMVDPDSGGTGFKDVDLKDVEERIKRKLSLRADASQPIPFTLLSGPETRGEAHRVVNASVVENSAGRFEPENSVREELTNGSLDVLHPVGVVACEK